MEEVAFANYHGLLNLPLIKHLKDEIADLKRENERMRNILLTSMEAQLLPSPVVKQAGTKVSDSFYPIFIKEEKHNIESLCNVRCDKPFDDEVAPQTVPTVATVQTVAVAPTVATVAAPQTVPTVAVAPTVATVAVAPTVAPTAPQTVEEEEKEEEEEEGEEEVEEIVIDGVTYFATGTEDGSKVYSCVDDDVGDLVGTLQGGLLKKQT